MYLCLYEAAEFTPFLISVPETSLSQSLPLAVFSSRTLAFLHSITGAADNHSILQLSASERESEWEMKVSETRSPGFHKPGLSAECPNAV